MNPFLMLADATTGSFNASTALELMKTVFTWIIDIIKGEPIMAAAFVVGILVPAGFAIVGRIKRISH